MVMVTSGIGDKYITTKKVIGYNYGENIVIPKGTVLILDQGDQYALEFQMPNGHFVILHREWKKDGGYSNYSRLPIGVKPISKQKKVLVCALCGELFLFNGAHSCKREVI